MRSRRLCRESNEYIRNFDGKHPGRWAFGRPRGSWEDNIKLEYKDIGCEDGRGGRDCLKIVSNGGL
jgi:hypothetical protein